MSIFNSTILSNPMNNIILKNKLDNTLTFRLQRHIYDRSFNKNSKRRLFSSSLKSNNLFSIKMRSNTKSNDLFILSRITFTKVYDMMYNYSSNIYRMHFNSISYRHENMDGISKDNRYNDYQIMF